MLSGQLRAWLLTDGRSKNSSDFRRSTRQSSPRHPERQVLTTADPAQEHEHVGASHGPSRVRALLGSNNALMPFGMADVHAKDWEGPYPGSLMCNPHKRELSVSAVRVSDTQRAMQVSKAIVRFSRSSNSYV